MARNELEILIRLRDQFSRGAKQARAALKGLEAELGRTANLAQRLNQQLEAAAPASRSFALALSGVAAAVGGLGVKAVATAGQFEQMRVAFTTMLGSAEKADRFLRQLYDFAAKTPFEIEGLQKQVQLLLALGFQAEEVIPTLTAVGDAVAALGGGADLLNRVVLALGQIRAKGKVSAEEMRQLAEAGIPAWEMLARKIGTDIPTAMKLAEKGAIDASTGVSAILEGMQQRFSGMMEVQSKTLLGIWSNIKDNLTRTLVALGEEIDRTFHVREAMQAFLAWLDEVRAWFEGGGIRRFLKEHAQAITELAGAITGALIPAIVQAIRGLTLFALRLAPWAAAGYAAVKILEALGVSFADLKRWAALGAQAISGLGKIFQAVVADAAGVVAFWRKALGGMIDAFQRALFFLDRAWDAIQKKNIEGARFALQTAANALAGGLKQAFEGATSESAAFFDRANKLATDGLTELFMTVDGTLGETAQAAQKAFEDIANSVEEAKDSITALANDDSAPIPTLNASLEETGQKAEDAANKVNTLSDAIQRQLEFLGQAAPRLNEYAKGLGRVVAPREGSDIVGGGTTPATIVPSYGGRGARRGLGSEVRAAIAKQAREEERARRNILKEEALETGIVTLDAYLEGLKKEFARSRDEMRRLAKLEFLPGERGVEPAPPRTPSGLERDSIGERNAQRFNEREQRETTPASKPEPPEWLTKIGELFGTLGQSVSNLLGSLNPFAAILERINPIGTIIASMLDRLAPVLEPITEVFAEMGGILAELLAPALKAILPIVKLLGRVFRWVAGLIAAVWNAFASAVNALLGWLGVHLEMIKLETEKAKKDLERSKPKEPAPPKQDEGTRAIRYDLPQAPVLAAPRWVDEMGKHVATFGKAVERFANTRIGVDIRLDGGNLAYSLRGVA